MHDDQGAVHDGVFWGRPPAREPWLSHRHLLTKDLNTVGTRNRNQSMAHNVIGGPAAGGAGWLAYHQKSIGWKKGARRAGSDGRGAEAAAHHGIECFTPCWVFPEDRRIARQYRHPIGHPETMDQAAQQVGTSSASVKEDEA
jgi:hypothetical protein